VVEDEADAREMMRELVELGGCSAVLAANGAEALKLLATERPCLIVLDLMMPVMDGATFLQQVQKDARLSVIPVVVATSAPHRAPSGARVLAKPIDVEQLWDCMRRVCRCHRGDAATNPD
jgi:CheY-like chemotaxis protein